MNEGALSGRLGLIGRPALAEEIMVMRDIELVRLTGATLHFLHLSTRRSLELVCAARDEGLPVSFEVAPHHFTLDESACADYDPVFKVHPPLRTRSDVDAVRDALRSGLVDAVATDHAPHVPELKDLAFDEAPAGMLGLEHAASLTVEAFGSSVDPQAFFQVMSRGPARIAQLRQADPRTRHSAHGALMVAGEDANVTVFDPTERWIVDRYALASRSMNTPYDGRTLSGRVRATVAKGHLVVDEGRLT
jgi:dihydroorotase